MATQQYLRDHGAKAKSRDALSAYLVIGSKPDLTKMIESVTEEK